MMDEKNSLTDNIVDKNRLWEEDWFWAEITTGIAIGVTVAALAGLFQLGAKWLRIHNQKGRIREIISLHIKQMKEVQDLTLPDGKTRCSANELRKTIYEALWREINTELTHKSSEISYEDEKKIRDSFFLINRFLSMMDENRVPSVEIYNNLMLTRLEEIKWLKSKIPKL